MLQATPARGGCAGPALTASRAVAMEAAGGS